VIRGALSLSMQRCYGQDRPSSNESGRFVNPLAQMPGMDKAEAAANLRSRMDRARTNRCPSSIEAAVA
jgi:hypothetical protein